MNLQDLAKLDVKDLKNIDYQKIFNDLKKNPDQIVIIALICLSLLFSTYYYLSRKKESQELKVEVAELEHKLTSIETYKKNNKELENFFASLPQDVNERSLINTIADIANKHNITIESFNPGRTTSETFYEHTNYQLTTVADNYVDMWLFVYEIEQSPYAIRLDQWQGKIKQVQSRGGYRGGRGNTVSINPEDIKIESSIGISLIKIKNDQKTETK